MKRFSIIFMAFGLTFSCLQSANAANSGNLGTCLYFDDLAARVVGDVLTLQSNVRQNSKTCSLYTPSDNTYQPTYSIPALGITCTGPALMTYSTEWAMPLGTLMCSGTATKYGTTVDYLVVSNDGRSASWAFTHDVIVDPNAAAKAAAEKAAAEKAAAEKAAAEKAAAEKAAAEKAAAEKAAAEKAAAEKAAAEKAAAEKAAAEKAAAEKAAAEKAAAEKAAAEKAAAELMVKQEDDAKAAAEKLVADARALADKIIADARTAASRSAVKKNSITCIKGKVIKKVSAVKPKCPTGYKKK
jgi:hypothetical protein